MVAMLRHALARLKCAVFGHVPRWHPPLLLGYGECRECHTTVKLEDYEA